MIIAVLFLTLLLFVYLLNSSKEELNVNIPPNTEILSDFTQNTESIIKGGGSASYSDIFFPFVFNDEYYIHLLYIDVDLLRIHLSKDYDSAHTVKLPNKLFKRDIDALLSAINKSPSSFWIRNPVFCTMAIGAIRQDDADAKYMEERLYSKLSVIDNLLPKEPYRNPFIKAFVDNYDVDRKTWFIKSIRNGGKPVVTHEFSFPPTKSLITINIGGADHINEAVVDAIVDRGYYKRFFDMIEKSRTVIKYDKIGIGGIITSCSNMYAIKDAFIKLSELFNDNLQKIIIDRIFSAHIIKNHQSFITLLGGSEELYEILINLAKPKKADFHASVAAITANLIKILTGLPFMLPILRINVNMMKYKWEPFRSDNLTVFSGIDNVCDEYSLIMTEIVIKEACETMKNSFDKSFASNVELATIVLRSLASKYINSTEYDNALSSHSKDIKKVHDKLLSSIENFLGHAQELLKNVLHVSITPHQIGQLIIDFALNTPIVTGLSDEILAEMIEMFTREPSLVLPPPPPPPLLPPPPPPLLPPPPPPKIKPGVKNEVYHRNRFYMDNIEASYSDDPAISIFAHAVLVKLGKSPKNTPDAFIDSYRVLLYDNTVEIHAGKPIIPSTLISDKVPVPIHMKHGHLPVIKLTTGSPLPSAIKSTGVSPPPPPPPAAIKSTGVPPPPPAAIKSTGVPPPPPPPVTKSTGSPAPAIKSTGSPPPPTPVIGPLPIYPNTARLAVKLPPVKSPVPSKTSPSLAAIKSSASHKGEYSKVLSNPKNDPLAERMWGDALIAKKIDYMITHGVFPPNKLDDLNRILEGLNSMFSTGVKLGLENYKKNRATWVNEANIEVLKYENSQRYI